MIKQLWKLNLSAYQKLKLLNAWGLNYVTQQNLKL